MESVTTPNVLNVWVAPSSAYITPLIVKQNARSSHLNAPSEGLEHNDDHVTQIKISNTGSYGGYAGEPLTFS